MILRRALLTLVVFGSITAACGGGDGGNIADVDGDSDPAASGRSIDCATELDVVLSRVNDATFAVFGGHPPAGGDGASGNTYYLMGTAWAVGEQLMATNAHVTEAFRVFADQGVQLTEAIAVQSRTGSVVTIKEGMTHPGYTGDPLGSPDVGLFTVEETLPVTLPLDPEPDIRLGDEILIVGFPGDVDEFLKIVPGTTVPQATSLTGRVTALRSHDLTQQVTADNLDVVQHQAPTTPGTSGSAMLACDEVIGLNNAGTVNLIVTPGADGEPTIDRAAAASNNFAVHVRHLHDVLEMLDQDSLDAYALPLQAGQGGGQSGQPAGEIVGTWLAQVSDGPAAHRIAFAIDDAGNITGLSDWSETGEFELTGQIASDGTFGMVDNAPERLGYRRGTYEGRIDAAGNVMGVYFEATMEDQTFEFVGQRTR